MSTARGCVAVEVARGKWYCCLADVEYDYDFTKGYETVGPESTAELAVDRATAFSSNPGGYSVVPLEKCDERMRALVDEGRRRSNRWARGPLKW